MAQPVYSTLFADLHEFEGTFTYDVTAGFVAIIRDVDVFWSFGLTGATLNVVGQAGGTFAYYETSAVPVSSEYLAWRGRQVVEPGSAFQVITSSALDVRVSGYLLTVP